MSEPRYDGERYLYKFTLPGARALYGDYAFSTPAKNLLPDWMPTHLSTGTSTVLRSYNGVTLENIIDWTGPELWLIESRDGWKMDADGDKMVARQARLVKRIAAWNMNSMVAFACDSAERLLPAFTTTYPKDVRPAALLAAIRKHLKAPDQFRSVYQALTAGEEAAEIAGHASYQARKERSANAPALLDAAQAARAIADIGKGLTSTDDLDFRLFIVRSEDAGERSWQRSRKLAYINGKA